MYGIVSGVLSKGDWEEEVGGDDSHQSERHALCLSAICRLAADPISQRQMGGEISSFLAF